MTRKKKEEKEPQKIPMYDFQQEVLSEILYPETDAGNHYQTSGPVAEKERTRHEFIRRNCPMRNNDAITFKSSIFCSCRDD